MEEATNILSQIFVAVGHTKIGEFCVFTAELEYCFNVVVNYYYILLHSFKPGKLAPEKQNHSGKTNVDLLEQKIVSGSGISWTICKSAPRSRQITMPAPHHSVFLQAGCPSCCQLIASKH